MRYTNDAWCGVFINVSILIELHTNGQMYVEYPNRKEVKKMTVRISNIRGLAEASDKSAFIKAFLEDLKEIAREQKARLGKSKLLNGEILQITIASDKLAEHLKQAVEATGMQFSVLNATETFKEKYRK